MNGQPGKQAESAPGRELSWPELIGFMGKLRMELAEAKPAAYPLTVPYLAAKEAQLREAEARLGHPLDSQHREFLSYGNGWPDFFVDTYLMSTDDLGQGDAWTRANQLLDIFYEDGPVPANFPPKSEVEPIAVGTEGTDLFVLWNNGPLTDGGHSVVWLAGDVVDRFANFREFFLSMYEYLKKALERTRVGG